MGVVHVARGRPQFDVGATVLDALDRLRVAVTLFDSDERLVYCNTHYNYIFRSLPPSETLIGASYEELIRLELEGGEIAEPFAADPNAFITGRRRQLHENDFRPLYVHLADNRVLELKSRATGDGGRVVLWSDATFTLRLLRRLEETIELSVDAFAFWNEKDALSLCNTLFAELHGFAVPDAAFGLSFPELMSHAVRHGKFAIQGSTVPWLERRLDAHQATAGALTVSTTAGHAYLVRERATRDGGSVTVLTDVSESHRAESALAEQTRALQRTRRALKKSKSDAKRKASYLADLTRRLDVAEAEADTAKATLLRTMSHELKTPLNAIIGFADLLSSAPGQFKPDQVGEYAKLIHTAGGNLLRLINQILDLTKIAAGRYPLHPVRISVATGFVRALEQHARRAEEKAIAVEGIDDAKGLFVTADEASLAAMLGHLIENAVSYTPASGRIRLFASRGDGFVRIGIQDNGPGVAEDDLERILEPFEQGGRGTADHSAGAGLGLPIVKALAELHGGSLGVASVLGEGFTATLDLPSA